MQRYWYWLLRDATYSFSLSLKLALYVRVPSSSVGGRQLGPLISSSITQHQRIIDAEARLPDQLRASVVSIRPY